MATASGSAVRWLARWPLVWLHRVGDAVGWIAYAFSPTYRRRFIANARQAGLTPAEYKPAIPQAGRLVMELALLWMRPDGESILPLVRWSGDQVILDALALGRGVIFLTPHMGCFEVTAQAYAERFAAEYGPITVLFRPARKAWLRPVIADSRIRPGLSTAPATLAGVRQMIRALRRGEAVGLLPDQVPPDGLGVWAPFFGKPAYTMTLAARLIEQTGAVPLLAWGERLGGDAGYVVHVSTFPDPVRLASPVAAEAAAAVNAAMERVIRVRPQQYLWGYHRYKAPARRMPGAG
jgi:KDO2-lipid IV(A) lauroyltransferase